MSEITKDMSDILEMEVRLFSDGKHISIAGKEQYREYIYLTYNTPKSAALKVWIDWMYDKFITMVRDYEHEIYQRDQQIAELQADLRAAGLLRDAG